MFWPQEASSILHFNFPEGIFLFFHSGVYPTPTEVLGIYSDCSIFPSSRIFHFVYWAFRPKHWVFQSVRIPQVLQNHTPPLSLKLFAWKSACCLMPAEEPRSLQREHALSPSSLRITEYKKRWECGINANSVDHGNYIKI